MKNNYINNADLYQAIVERKKELKKYKKNKLTKPPLSNYIGNCLLLICQNLAHLPRFTNYPHKEEMIGDGVENCIRYFDNFNLKYKNPHAYFTQIAYYAFVRRIKKENDQLYAKYKLHEQMGVLGIKEGVNESAVASQFQVYENISDFIERHEAKQKEKKEKLALKKAEQLKVVKKKFRKRAVKRKAKKKSRRRHR